jgi:hypothetical protein
MKLVLASCVASLALSFVLAFRPTVAVAANIYWDRTGTASNSAASWFTSSLANMPNLVAPPGAVSAATSNTKSHSTLPILNFNAYQSAADFAFSISG